MLVNDAIKLICILTKDKIILFSYESNDFFKQEFPSRILKSLAITWISFAI